jgi:hypothetical protein
MFLTSYQFPGERAASPLRSDHAPVIIDRVGAVVLEEPSRACGIRQVSATSANLHGGGQNYMARVIITSLALLLLGSGIWANLSSRLFLKYEVHGSGRRCEVEDYLFYECQRQGRVTLVAIRRQWLAIETRAL